MSRSVVSGTPWSGQEVKWNCRSGWLSLVWIYKPRKELDSERRVINTITKVSKRQQSLYAMCPGQPTGTTVRVVTPRKELPIVQTAAVVLVHPLSCSSNPHDVLKRKDRVRGKWVASLTFTSEAAETSPPPPALNSDLFFPFPLLASGGPTSLTLHLLRASQTPFLSPPGDVNDHKTKSNLPK